MAQRTSETQKRILNAALLCFTQYGIEATSIEQIREGADASVGSIYHHFGNKDGIAVALYKEGLRQFTHSLFKDMQAVTSIEQMIAVTIHSNIDWIVENQDWARFVFKHRHVLKENAQEEPFKQEVKTVHQALTNQWLNLKDSELLISLPMEMYQSCLIGPTHHYAREWLDGRVEASPKEMSDYLVNAACRSLLK